MKSCVLILPANLVLLRRDKEDPTLRVLTTESILSDPRETTPVALTLDPSRTKLRRLRALPNPLLSSVDNTRPRPVLLRKLRVDPSPR